MAAGSRTWRSRVGRGAVVCWPLVLTGVLCWPLLSREGYPLARDLVFVPRQPLTETALGLGEGLPRAVPLDAAMSVVTTVADGGLLARVVVPLGLVLAAWGVLRLLAGAGVPAGLAAGGLAVWNPYVVERLALGQWALLLAYGALPWIFAAAASHRRHGRRRDLAGVLAWSGLASLTPTGGLLALAAVVAGGAARSSRSLVAVVGVLVLQAPWVVASLMSEASGRADPSGADVFGPDTDGPGGPVIALLGLGGIWDDFSEPATRGTWLAPLAALVTCAVLAVGVPALRRRSGSRDPVRMAVLAGVCALVPLLAALPGGADVVGWLGSEVPGGGLLRDSQKLLAPLAVLAAAALGALVEDVRSRLAAHGPELVATAVLPLVASPLLLLPDATTVTWPTLDPVQYPAEVRSAYTALDGPEAQLRTVVLPWRSYRLFSWGNGRTSSDPAERWIDGHVLVSGDLQVGDVLVEGESAVLRAIGDALEDAPPAEVLPRFGVDRVLVYRDDPAAPDLELDGLVPLVEDELVAVYEVPAGDAVVDHPSSMRSALVVAAHLAWLAVSAGALAVLVGGFVRGRRGQRSEEDRALRSAV